MSTKESQEDGRGRRGRKRRAVDLACPRLHTFLISKAQALIGQRLHGQSHLFHVVATLESSSRQVTYGGRQCL